MNDRAERKIPDGPVVPIRCDGHTHAILIAGRYLRWRCTDRKCPANVQAVRKGQWLYHIQDLETGEQWDDLEPASGRAA